jgi:hypothetical protein
MFLIFFAPAFLGRKKIIKEIKNTHVRLHCMYKPGGREREGTESLTERVVPAGV